MLLTKPISIIKGQVNPRNFVVPLTSFLFIYIYFLLNTLPILLFPTDHTYDFFFFFGEKISLMI